MARILLAEDDDAVRNLVERALAEDGHVLGRQVIAAEAFTANDREAWTLYPAALKNQGDWAFAMGLNRLVYHTFAHKPYGDRLRPGVTMGPYGVHWDRGPRLRGRTLYTTVGDLFAGLCAAWAAAAAGLAWRGRRTAHGGAP